MIPTTAPETVTIAQKQKIERRTMRTEFENKKLAEFLEDAVHSLIDLDPNAIAIVAISDDKGIAGTNYYGCGVEDKGRMIHHINEDIIMDVILNNAKTIHDVLIESEDDGEEDEDDDTDASD